MVLGETVREHQKIITLARLNSLKSFPMMLASHPATTNIEELRFCLLSEPFYL